MERRLNATEEARLNHKELYDIAAKEASEAIKAHQALERIIEHMEAEKVPQTLQLVELQDAFQAKEEAMKLLSTRYRQILQFLSGKIIGITGQENHKFKIHQILTHEKNTNINSTSLSDDASNGLKKTIIRYNALKGESAYVVSLVDLPFVRVEDRTAVLDRVWT